MTLQREREQVVRGCKMLLERGLTKGTGGNISAMNRAQNLVAISPSAVEYDSMSAADVAVVTPDGDFVEGGYAPSSEMPMHLACYKKRADIGAVVHTHSVYCTVLACLHQELPPVHYLLGWAGGSVACIPYELFGTAALAQSAAAQLQNRNAVLLGNHGLLAVGGDVAQAFNVAEETEFVAEIYYKTKCVGAAHILGQADMDAVLEKFDSYRQVEKKGP